jgi:Uma2 family endonuclease
LRAADVGFVTATRDRATSGDDFLMGAPDLVIEVLSTSNRKGDMAERRSLCLSTGSQEFWIVDPKRQTVEVFTPDGSSKTYQSGDVIPLTLPSQGELPVAKIFTEAA